MLAVASCFQLTGKPISSARYGSGHINETYYVPTDAGVEYIIQKINRYVFTNPPANMRNIVAVTDFLRLSANSSREVLTLIPSTDGGAYVIDEDGEFWRAYEFITDSISLDMAESPEDFAESGAAFGRFQRDLAGFDASVLTETIPRFHDTPNRFKQLDDAIANNSADRLNSVGREVDFALKRREYAKTLTRFQSAGSLPLRVTHNDSKLNNVLLDRNTRKALCVIDLDTVMPGLAVNDFGDSIRFGASTASEDERDLQKVTLSLKKFEAYARAYLANSSLINAEIECLCDGAKMMTLECGVRFLTDYLNGDRYFHITREGHNLDRCRTQFKLVADMERQWDAMRKITEVLSNDSPDHRRGRLYREPYMPGTYSAGL